MSRKIKAALYPIYADTLPIVRYIIRYRSDIEVVELLSPYGSGVCGKDASWLDNRELLGMQVHPYQMANTNLWDEVYLLEHETIGMTNESNYESLYSPMIRIAQNSNRRILKYPYDLSRIISINEYAENLFNMSVSNLSKVASPKRIKVFLILVVGAISESSTFETALNLYGELNKHVHAVAFSSSKNAGICGMFSLYSLLHECQISSEHKALILANEIDKKSKENQADIILLHLDEAILPLDETKTNGFGIVPYIVSQVVVPDYCICCLPYCYSNPLFIEDFGHELEGRFGFCPDHWQISNSIIDYSSLLSPRGVGMIHVPIYDVVTNVNSMIEKGFDIGCDVLPTYLNKTIDKILLEFNESQLIASIL